jgi:RHS repeat-associated protein
MKSVSTGLQTVYVYDIGGKLVAEYSSGAASVPPCHTCFLSTDHLGSTRLVTDENGNTVSRHDYIPFGEEIAANTGGRDSTFGTQDFVNQKFTGKERDQETGLDFFGARYMSSALGRFTSPDVPLADQWEKDPQSWNLYSYVRNNPLRAIDPTGRKCVDTSNGPADDGTGGGCAAAGVHPNGNIQPQQVNVNAQGGNQLTAFGLNLLFALSNVANDAFRFIAPDSQLLSNTPTNREFTGQLATGVAVVGTGLIGPGGAQAPLRLIHSPATLSKTILDGLRKKSTQEIVESLKPGLEEALRVKEDGRVMNGNHRITVLLERGVDVNSLPREVVK